MMFDITKFNKEIKALPGLLRGGGLNSARQQAVKDRILSSIKTAEAPAIHKFKITWMEKYDRILRYAVSVLLGISLVGGTSFAASGNAQPGDILYPIKLVREKVQLTFAGSQESKAKLKTRFAENRLNELHKLSGGDEATANLTGQSALTDVKGAPAAPTSLSNENHRRQGKLKLQAQTEARAEVKDALKELKKLNLRFKSQGNAQAAAGVSADILNLQTQANAQHIGLDSEDNASGGNDNRENSGSQLQATTSITTQTQVETDVNSGGKNPAEGERQGDSSDPMQTNPNGGLPINK